MKKEQINSMILQNKGIRKLLVIIICCLFGFAIESRAQDAKIADPKSNEVFHDYILKNKESAIAKLYMQYPNDQFVLNAMKIASVLNNPSKFNLSSQDIDRVAQEFIPISAEANYLITELNNGGSIEKAQAKYQRNAAEINHQYIKNNDVQVKQATDRGSNTETPAMSVPK